MTEPSHSRRPSRTAGPARVAGNTGALVFGQAVQFLVTFVASMFMVRSLGSDGYGIFVFVYAFTGLFEWLAGFGVENTLVRKAVLQEAGSESTDAAKPGVLFGSAIGLTAVSSLAAAGVATLAALALGYRGQMGALLAVAGIEVIALVPPRLLGAVLQVRLEMWKAVTVTSARHIAWLGAVVLLVRAEAPVGTFVAVRTAIAVLEVMVISFVSIRSLRDRLSLASSTALGLAKESWSLAFIYLAIAVNLRVDRVLIERLVGPSDLGIYAVADNVGGLLLVLPFAFARSIYPEICRRLESADRFDSAVRTSFRVSTAVMGLIVVGLFSLGPFLIRLAYGEEFARSGDILRILLIGQLGATYGAVVGVVLLSKALQKAMLYSTVVTAALNFLGNLIAIPRWGIAGAAWVTAGCYWISSSLLLEVIRQTREANRLGMKVFVRAVPGLALGLAVALITTNLIALALLAPVVSFAAFVAFGLISRSDWASIRQLLPSKSRNPAIDDDDDRFRQ